jgi:hypothetical protein
MKRVYLYKIIKVHYIDIYKKIPTVVGDELYNRILKIIPIITRDQIHSQVCDQIEFHFKENRSI